MNLGLGLWLTALRPGSGDSPAPPEGQQVTFGGDPVTFNGDSVVFTPPGE